MVFFRLSTERLREYTKVGHGSFLTMLSTSLITLAVDAI
jgi:hypothetical protein